MSTGSDRIPSGDKISAFYTDHLSNHGDSSKGVGWKDDAAQEIRFEQLTRLIQTTSFTINDLGCGTGKSLSFLTKTGKQPSVYHGYDILDEMVAAAKASLPVSKSVQIKKIDSAGDMDMADYTIASGIFNVKYDADEETWRKYVLDTIEEMNEKSVLGFAFNHLTSYSDEEFMKDYLYYADPLFLFDHCKKKYSKNVALLHDYNQFDFTLIVRK